MKTKDDWEIEYLNPYTREQLIALYENKGVIVEFLTKEQIIEKYGIYEVDRTTN